MKPFSDGRNSLFHLVVKGALKTLVGNQFVSLPKYKREDLERDSSKYWDQMFTEFRAHENRPDREDLFREMMNFFVILNDSDRYYRERIKWMVEYIQGHPYQQDAREGKQEVRERWWKK